MINITGELCKAIARSKMHYKEIRHKFTGKRNLGLDIHYESKTLRDVMNAYLYETFDISLDHIMKSNQVDLSPNIRISGGKSYIFKDDILHTFLVLDSIEKSRVLDLEYSPEFFQMILDIMQFNKNNDIKVFTVIYHIIDRTPANHQVDFKYTVNSNDVKSINSLIDMIEAIEDGSDPINRNKVITMNLNDYISIEPDDEDVINESDTNSKLRDELLKELNNI